MSRVLVGARPAPRALLPRASRVVAARCVSRPALAALRLVDNGASDVHRRRVVLCRASRGPGGAGESRAPDPGGPRGDGDGDDGARFRAWLFESELPKSGKAALRSLSSLKLAIGEFLVIAGFSALGTVIEQNKGNAWYVANYPTETPAFGFIDYPFILDLGLDHVYTTWYFLFLLGALGSSLAACTLTRQLPVWRVSAEWKFLDRPAALMRMEEAETLPRAKLSDLAENLSRRGYQVFVKGKKLYAFKGLIGRLAPIGVHAALLLTLGGSAFSGLGGLGGSVMIPEGASFQIAQGLTRGAMFAPTPKAARDAVVVNDFTIEYLPNGQVSQFFSDLSVVDGKSGAEKQRKVISVNVPLREGGVTMYQTDWSMASMRVSVADEADAASRGGDAGPAPEDGAATSPVSSASEEGNSLLLPMANLEGKGNFQGRIWGAFLPLNPGATDPALARRGASLLARDFQSVAVYSSDGSFAGVRRPGSGRPIVVDGKRLVIEELKGSTGLELKTDPGVPLVYAGFAGLLATSFLSLLSHSQVWGKEEDSGESGAALLHVGGRSNRAKEEFKSELNDILDEMPEYLS